MYSLRYTDIGFRYRLLTILSY